MNVQKVLFLCIYIELYFRLIEIFIMAILFLYGAKLAWGVRHATSDFNESVSLASTIAVMLVIGVILVPLDFLMTNEPASLLIFRSFGTEIGVFGILLLQFTNIFF